MDLTWKRLLSVSLVSALAACNTGDDDKTDDTGTDDSGDTETCTSGIKGDPVPAPGDVDVFVKTTFSLEFVSDESTTASFELYEGEFSESAAPTGTAIGLETPTWAGDGKSVFFAPSEILKPTTKYTLVVGMSCDKTAYITFTTSNVGAAVTGDQILMNSYAVDLESATIVEPAGVGSLLSSLIGGVTQTVALVPESLDMDDNLRFYGGLVDGSGGVFTQECEITIEFDEDIDFASNPFFELSAETLTLDVSDISITLQDVELSGAFTPDGGDIVGITLAGEADTRLFLDLLGDELPGDGDDAACQLLNQLTGGKVDCIDCPDGSGTYCLRLVLTNAVAEGIDLELVKYDQDDVDNECMGGDSGM